MREKTWRCLSRIQPETQLTEEVLDALYQWTGLALDYYQTSEVFRSLNQMSVKTRTLFLPEGKVLSKDVATILVKEYSSGFGFAVASQDEPGVDVSRGLGAVNADKLVALTEGNKDNKLILWMIQSDQPIKESDLQPFSLIDDEIVCCLDGDFSGWAQDGSSDTHTNEYHACEKRIKPKMIKLWKSNDSDREKFASAMKDPEGDDTIDQMFEMCPDNASIVYLTAAGLCGPVSKPEDREMERPWGYEYAGPTQAVDKPSANPNKKKTVLSLKDDAPSAPAADKKDKPADDKTNVLGGRFADVQNQVVKVKDKEFPFVLALKQDGVTPIDVGSTNDAFFPPPPDIDTKERLDAFYKKELGYRPSNWRQRPWIKRVSGAKAINLADLQNGTSAAALQTAATNKDTTTNYVPAPKVMQRTVAEQFLNTEYPKIVGNNSEFIANPDAILKNEEKDASAAAMMNDKRFVSIKDFDMPHPSRCFLLSKIGGPASDSYIALLSAIWRDNMIARIHAERKVLEQQKRIEALEKDRDDALKLATEAQKPVAKDEPAAPATKKKVFALK